MSRQMTTAGLTALCALAFGALAASAAQAENTTAYTCLPGGSEFSDAHCVGTGTGFHHVAIPAGERTELTLNTVAGNEGWSLPTEIFGVALVAEWNKIECVGCTAENKEISAMEMDVKGPAIGELGGRIIFRGAKLVGFETKCKIEDPVTGLGAIRTEPLKFTTTGTDGVKIEPEAGRVLAVIHIVSTGKCPIVGTVEVEGFFEGTAAGATLKVNDTTDLTVLGEPAGLTGEATLEAGKEGVHHPMALT